MKNINNLIVIVLILLLVSCSKEEEIPVTTFPEVFYQNEEFVGEYTQIEIGNYWIYQGYYVNTDDGTESIVEYLVDSVYVEKDTLINGFTYYIQKGGLFGTGAFKRIMRIYNNQLVSPTGEVFFKLIDEPGLQTKKDTLSINTTVGDNQIDSIYNIMEESQIVISAPIMNYTVFNHRHQVFYTNNGYKPIRYKSDYYSVNIGVVQYTSYIENGPIDVHMRLLRYHVN